jgi:hypothetical protein
MVVTAMPEIICGNSDLWAVMAAAGMVGIFVYAIAIPAMLFKQLHTESREKGDGDAGFFDDHVFMESHGWLVLRCENPVNQSADACDDESIQTFPGSDRLDCLWTSTDKPSRWWFEFPLSGFKVAVIFASELMNSDEMAFPLLMILVAVTTLLLVLVIHDTP